MRAIRFATVLVAVVAGVTGLSVYAAPAPRDLGAASVPRHAVEDGSISGTVVDGSGKPVSGARVLLFHREYRRRTPASAAAAGGKHFYRETVTDSSGHFAFDKVHPGEHLLVAHEKGEGHGRVADHLKPGAADSVTITLQIRHK